MIPGMCLTKSTKAGVLHVCGDDPSVDAYHNTSDQCSPRMWR